MTDFDAAPVPGQQALAQAQGAGTDNTIKTEPPQVTGPRAANVADLLEWATYTRDRRKSVFDRMRRDMKFAVPGRQWPGNESQAKYEANITHRTMRSRVSGLYAKNPQVVAKRKPRMDFALWDGDPQALMIAAASLQGTGPMDPQQAQMLIADYQQGIERRQIIKAFGRTLETLVNYYFGEGTPVFKTQLKQLIRRVEACGVGFVQLGYQRLMEKSPELTNKHRDVYDQICNLERLAAVVAQGIVPPDSKEVEQLRQSLKQLESDFDVLVREGLVFDFPKSTTLLVDLNCTGLKGFINANRVAREYYYTTEQVQELFKVNVSQTAKKYNIDSGAMIQGTTANKNVGVCVLYICERSTNLEYFVCDGWPDYLREPAAPQVQLEQFFPWFTLSFHDLETDEAQDIYPPSTYQFVRPMNLEYNRAREAVRVHRIASRPAYISGKNTFGKEDKTKLATHADFALIELDLPSEAMGKPIEDFLMSKPVMKIDPLVYDVEGTFQDVQRVVGEAEANIGGTSPNVTATQSTIAEQSRLSTNQADVDELDDFLSALARGAGQVLMANMSPQTVAGIVGPAAVWPEVTATQMAEEVYLEVKAGSSGRPNKAMEVANLERMVPLLVQIPGIKPIWLAQTAMETLDHNLDLEEAFDASMPSITLMNAAKQPSTGNPASDPNAQGGAGGENADRPAQSVPGPKPDLPGFPGQGPPAG